MGIVHADLKPDNIMFGSGTENNHMVKIIDFGWAFLIKDAEVMYRKKFQAVPYRAPEVCFRARLGHGLDVWALGCIMAEIATGQKLFDVSEEKHLVKMMIRALSVPTFLVADSENIDLETNLSDGWVQFKVGCIICYVVPVALLKIETVQNDDIIINTFFFFFLSYS